MSSKYLMPGLLIIIYIILMFLIKSLRDKLILSIPLFSHGFSFILVCLSVLLKRPVLLVSIFAYLVLFSLIICFLLGVILLFFIKKENKNLLNYSLLSAFSLLNGIILFPAFIVYDVFISGHFL